MGRVSAAVLDAGPLIHLGQIDGLETLRVVRKCVVTTEVVLELGRGFALPRTCAVRTLGPAARDFAAFLCSQDSLGLGEATSIALARQERIRLFFTDDLGAREAAARYGLEPHGTLALLARACREGVVSRTDALSLLESLHRRSSLFLTSELVDWARRQILAYSRG